MCVNFLNREDKSYYCLDVWETDYGSEQEKCITIK